MSFRTVEALRFRIRQDGQRWRAQVLPHHADISWNSHLYGSPNHNGGSLYNKVRCLESWSSILQNPIQPLPLAKDRKYNGLSRTYEKTLWFPTNYPSFKVGKAASHWNVDHRWGKAYLNKKSPWNLTKLTKSNGYLMSVNDCLIKLQIFFYKTIGNFFLIKSYHIIDNNILKHTNHWELTFFFKTKSKGSG